MLKAVKRIQISKVHFLKVFKLKEINDVLNFKYDFKF